MPFQAPACASPRNTLRTLFALSLLTFGSHLTQPAQAAGRWWCKVEVKDPSNPTPPWGVSDVMVGAYHYYPGFPHDWGLLGGSAWWPITTPTTTPVFAGAWSSGYWDEDKDDTANIYFGEETSEWWLSQYAIDAPYTVGPGKIKFRFKWADQNDESIPSPSDQPSSISIHFQSGVGIMCVSDTTFSHTDELTLSNYLLNRGTAGIHYFLDDGFGDAASGGFPYSYSGQYEAISTTNPLSPPSYNLSVPTSGANAGMVEKDVYMQGYVSGNCGTDTNCLTNGYSIHLEGGINGYIDP